MTKFVWPSFIWSLLRNKEIQEKCGDKHIWRLIPVAWRMWWLDSIKMETRLTTPTLATSTDPGYCAFSYDMMTNLTTNHKDTRVILNRGLTVGDDKTGGLGLRGKGDSTLLESTDKNASVDKITQFSLRQPELLKLVDMVGNYFRWFQISETMH